MPHTCIVPGCDKPQHSKGYCGAHYIRKWRYGNPTARECSTRNCHVGVFAKGLCKKHYAIMWRIHAEAHRDDSIESRLEKARQAYDLVTGLENRIRWRREISELEKQLKEETERNLHHAGCH